MKKFTADLHIHTKHSFDSLSEPKDVIAAAVRKGLSAIAITDHNEIAGALEAQTLAKEMGAPLQVIAGEEVATERGDLLVYFVKSRIMPGKLSAVLSEAEGQGAVCCAAHPYDFARHGIALEKIPESDLSRIGAIEAMNARTALASQNRQALLFASERGKPVLASSDAHHPSEVGACFTEFSGVKRLTAESLLSSERKLAGKPSSPLVRLYSRYAAMRKRLSIK